MDSSEVRRLRKKLSLTQAALAERLGVTASSVARWEQGVLGIRESAARLLLMLAEQAGTSPVNATGHRVGRTAKRPRARRRR